MSLASASLRPHPPLVREGRITLTLALSHQRERGQDAPPSPPCRGMDSGSRGRGGGRGRRASLGGQDNRDGLAVRGRRPLDPSIRLSGLTASSGWAAPQPRGRGPGSAGDVPLGGMDSRLGASATLDSQTKCNTWLRCCHGKELWTCRHVLA